MDKQTEQYLAQLTADVRSACIGLGADTHTTLKLVRRARGLLCELTRLYERRDRAHYAALLQRWTQEQDASASAELLEASPP
jgi:hypothetical protein